METTSSVDGRGVKKAVEEVVPAVLGVVAVVVVVESLAVLLLLVGFFKAAVRYDADEGKDVDAVVIRSSPVPPTRPTR